MSFLVLTDERREKRRKQWESMLEKYLKRGQLDTSECKFSEVDYKLFAKLKKKKFQIKSGKKKIRNKCNEKNNDEEIYHKNDENETTETDVLIDVDVSEIIDEDNVDISGETATLSMFQESDSSENGESTDENAESTDSGMDDTYDKNINIQDKIRVTPPVNKSKVNEFNEIKKNIEMDLNSNLKEVITNKSICRLLEIDGIDYWHNCIKQEMARLSNHIPLSGIKEYMRYCYQGSIPKCVNGKLFKSVIEHKMGSNLRELLLKREFTRDKPHRYLKYSKLIHMEWQRLCDKVPVDYLLVYGFSVLSVPSRNAREINNIKSS